ncbi:MAG: universal stress protein [Deltaproteobacteria bacterium]|nr:universal stress protein [Deltaproteobacteria bacterium]
MFNKILVPLDGSELAAKVIPQAEDLAKLSNAQLVLLAVGSGRGSAIQHYMEQTTASLQEKNLQATWVYRQGNPAQEIIAYAGDNQVDLIIIATHGAGEFAWLMGSVAQRVLRHASAPVLLVRVLPPKPPEHKSELDYFSM